MDYPAPDGDPDPSEPPPPLPEDRGARLPPVPPPPAPPGTGTPDPFGGFGDRFKIEDRLPWPSPWIAFVAHDRVQDRRVALRVPSPPFLLPDPKPVLHAFARAATHLGHHNILPILDFGEEDARGCFVTTPLFPGEWLAPRLQRERFRPLPAVLDLAEQVSAALTHAHAAGILHGDLSPDSIYLSGDQVFVADFGVSLARQAIAGSGGIVGNPAYMSPERITDASPLDPRSDVYSLAAILYELVTGVSPHPLHGGPPIPPTRGQKPPSVRSVRPDLPPALDATLRQALAPDVAHRPESAAAFYERLQDSTATARPQRSLKARLRALFGLSRPSA